LFAKASCAEVQSQLYRAMDRGHLTSEEFLRIENELTEINKMIGGLIKYLNKSDIKGTKFKSSLERNRN
jgi:four helix bundle protein